jgi:hypothetical protein
LTTFMDVLAEGGRGVGKRFGIDGFQVVVNGSASAVGAELGGVGLEEKEERFQFGVYDAVFGKGLRAVRRVSIGTDDIQEERRGSALKNAVGLSIDHRMWVGSYQLLEGRHRWGLLRVREELVGGQVPGQVVAMDMIELIEGRAGLGGRGRGHLGIGGALRGRCRREHGTGSGHRRSGFKYWGGGRGPGGFLNLIVDKLHDLFRREEVGRRGRAWVGAGGSYARSSLGQSRTVRWGGALSRKLLGSRRASESRVQMAGREGTEEPSMGGESMSMLA